MRARRSAQPRNPTIARTLARSYLRPAPAPWLLVRDRDCRADEETPLSPGSVRVGIVGVGNCASPCPRLAYYRGANANEPVPGLMNSISAAITSATSRSRRAFDIAQPRSGAIWREAIVAPPNNTQRFADVAETGIVVQRGRTSTGSANTCATRSRNRTSAVADVAAPCAERRRRVCLLSAGRLGEGDRVLCRAGARRRLRLCQLHPGLHRLDAGMARDASKRGCRSSATTSRARSARRSSIGCSPTCSASAASASTGPTS